MVRNAFDVPGLKILNSPPELTNDTNSHDSKQKSKKVITSRKGSIKSSSNSSDSLK